LGGEDADGKAEKKEKDCVSQKKPRKIRADAVDRKELGRIKGGVVAQEEESGYTNDEQVQNRKIWDDAIENEQGRSEKEEKKLERE
jgi:hypothetical protein